MISTLVDMAKQGIARHSLLRKQQGEDLQRDRRHKIHRRVASGEEIELQEMTDGMALNHLSTVNEDMKMRVLSRRLSTPSIHK
jgi:hypothetical protein